MFSILSGTILYHINITSLNVVCNSLVSPINQLVAYRTWEKEVAGSIPRLGQASFGGFMVVIQTGFILGAQLSIVSTMVMGKQPVAWKEYCAEYQLKERQESMYRYTGHHDITEIVLKKGIKLYTISRSIDTFWCPLKTSPLQTLCEKEKLVVTSNFSFSHSVFYLFG